MNAIGKHSNIDQPSKLQSGSASMTISKTVNLNNSITINEGLGKSNLPSLCYLNPKGCKSLTNVTMSVSH